MVSMSKKKCAYCGEERDAADMKRGEIIFQGGDWIAGRWVRRVKRKTNDYCKDKGCHGYDQMAHEG